jgi:Ssp1 endopeptidase immunity protein Rap1a
VGYEEDNLMRMALLSLLAALPVASSTVALGQQDISAKAYYLGCKAFAQGQFGEGPAVSQGACAGAMVALLGVAGHLNPEFSFCPPSGENAGQMARVVVAGMDIHPQLMHEPFIALAITILRDTWPCAH